MNNNLTTFQDQADLLNHLTDTARLCELFWDADTQREADQVLSRLAVVVGSAEAAAELLAENAPESELNPLDAQDE
jgi:hypothetical protein